jgi:gliding motility-associated-like protein
MIRSAYKKPIFFALSLFFGVIINNANATHLVGGELTYTYIGDSTGIPYNYCIRLVVHRSDAFSSITTLPATQQVCIRSSCYPNTTITANLVPGMSTGGIPVPDQDECVESNSPDFVQVYEHIYEVCVVLPGVCSDYIFSHTMTCCRVTIGNITNYSVSPPNDMNYLEAKLNNTQGENTSPTFLTSPTKSFCTNNFFTWSQASIEPDNDSIQYSFGTAMNGPCMGPSVNMIFQAPYDANNPLATAPGTTINIDRTGLITFTTSTTTGFFIVVVHVTELRLHPTGNFYYEVGGVMREMMVNIVGQCKQAVADGPTFDPNKVSFEQIPTNVLGIIGNNYPIPNADSVPDPNSPTGYSMEWPVVEYECYDSIVTMFFDTRIQCGSISQDASEFRIVGPDSNLVPIVDIEKNCDVAFETTRIDLFLHQPLAVEGDYYMYIKEGSDGNTLLNSCGFPMAEFYGIVIRVVNCTEPLYDIKNVSVVNNDHIEIFWEPDTTTFPLFAVSGWYFFRSDDQGATFNQVGSKAGPNAGYQTSWLDRSVDNEDVNSQTYRYQVQMGIGSEFFMITRDITSILLEKGQGYGQNRNYPLEWNHYDGWVSPEYNLMIWDIDVNTWSLVNQPGNPTANNSINFDYSLIEDEKDKSFALRIDAKNPGAPGVNYTAMSNYVYITVPLVPPPPPIDEWEVEDLVIPNVFTPDGDGKNDIYAIKGIEGFQSAEVTITNRWGNVVFRDDNFKKNNKWDGRDMRTGQMVADGTYFYIVRLRGSVLGKPDVEETGSLSIFGAGSR